MSPDRICPACGLQMLRTFSPSTGVAFICLDCDLPDPLRPPAATDDSLAAIVSALDDREVVQ